MMNDLEGEKLLKKAEAIAKKEHDGQFRYDGKTPSIEHPKAVAESFIIEEYPLCDRNDYEPMIVAWLHDVIEDTSITYDILIDEGIPRGLVHPISILTRSTKESYLDYILRIKKNESARKVKLADLEHNILTSSKKHQTDKYLLAQYILRTI